MNTPSHVVARYARDERAYILETGKHQPITSTCMAIDQYTSQFDEQFPRTFSSRWRAYQWALRNGYRPAFLRKL